MVKPLPPYKTLIHLFYVIDGILYWKNPKAENIKVGSVAGSANKRGYLSVKTGDENYKNHRIIWKIYNGCDPEGQIDHIDGNPSNNNIENLRVVSNIGNSKNQPLRTNNTSGVVGVSWNNRFNKWVVQIGVNRKKKQLGYFKNKNEAIKVRKKAEKKYGYHKNHGRLKLIEKG